LSLKSLAGVLFVSRSVILRAESAQYCIELVLSHTGIIKKGKRNNSGTRRKEEKHPPSPLSLFSLSLRKPSLSLARALAYHENMKTFDLFAPPPPNDHAVSLSLSLPLSPFYCLVIRSRISSCLSPIFLLSLSPPPTLSLLHAAALLSPSGQLLLLVGLPLHVRPQPNHRGEQ